MTDMATRHSRVEDLREAGLNFLVASLIFLMKCLVISWVEGAAEAVRDLDHGAPT